MVVRRRGLAGRPGSMRHDPAPAFANAAAAAPAAIRGNTGTQRVQSAQRIRLFDVLIFCLILAYVWRIQDLFPVLSALQFPIISSLGALVVFVFGGYAKKAFPRFKTPLITVAVFILFWMMVSVPTSVYQGLSFRFVFDDHLKTFLMMLMIVASIRAFADVERLMLVGLLGAGIYCLMILTTLQVGQSGRLGDLFYYDANDLAMMVVCTLPLTVYFLRRGARPWQRVLALGCAAAFALAIVRTGSRGGFLGLIAVAAFMLIAFRAIPARVRFAALGGSAVLLFAFAGPQYWTMMGTLLRPTADYNWSENNDAGRMAIWKRGMRYMANSPITGVGVNAFPVAEGKISPLASRQQLGIGLKWSAAHNSFVQIGAELGIPGLIAFLLLLYRMFSTAWRISRDKSNQGPTAASERAMAETVVASLVGYVVAGFFLSQAYSAYLYATCGILTGLAVIAGERGMTKSLAIRPSLTQFRRRQPTIA